VQVHVHDNHGVKDEHLWPGEGNIDWPAAIGALKKLSSPPATVLEVSQKFFDHPDPVAVKIQKGFEKIA